jgi:hypothetical protein
LQRPAAPVGGAAPPLSPMLHSPNRREAQPHL